jgi:hypothetical protein
MAVSNATADASASSDEEEVDESEWTMEEPAPAAWVKGGDLNQRLAKFSGNKGRARAAA